MSKAHFIAPRATVDKADTVRLGTTAAKFSVLDVGKLTKLAAESQYNLCVAGDPIEAIVLSVSTSTSAGFAVGSVLKGGLFFAIADGLQATPGTGTLLIGDFLVCGAVSALNTALPLGFPRVGKATQQPGITEATVIGDVNDQLRVGLFPWRVVSLGTGAGAVGTVVVIERV